MMIIVIIGVFLFTILIIGNFFDNKIIEFLISITFCIILFVFFAFIFSKKGLIIEDKRLFNGYFFLNYLLIKRNIDLSDKSAVSILRLRKSQNLPSVGIVYPSSSHSFYRFEVYLLNIKHTIKKELINFKKEKNAEKTIDFLTNNLNLKFEKYNPRF